VSFGIKGETRPGGLRRAKLLGGKALLALGILGAATLAAAAQPAPQAHITFNAAHQTFRIDAGQTTYAFGVDTNHELENLYWGARLQPGDQLPAAQLPRSGSSFDAGAPGEFTGWGGMIYVVPDLKITFPDGNRDLVLHSPSP
jgi:alpha-galactosidase